MKCSEPGLLGRLYYPATAAAEQPAAVVLVQQAKQKASCEEVVHHGVG